MKAMIKPFRKTNGEFVAYNAEKNFLDKVSEMGDNMLDHGTVATDTLEIGPLQVHWALKSPFKVQSNGESTTIGFSGGTHVEIGVTFNHGNSGGGNGNSGSIPRDANPFYDPSVGSSGEGNGHENRPRG